MSPANGPIRHTVSMQELGPLIRERLECGQTVRFSPKGSSMLPMLREGRDTVVLAPVPEEVKKYDVVLYRRDNGRYVLHRIVRVGQTYTCIGDNQYVYEPELHRDQFFAVVTGFCRRGREHAVTEPGYRLYCRLWHLSRGLRHFLLRAIRWTGRHLRWMGH